MFHPIVNAAKIPVAGRERRAITNPASGELLAEFVCATEQDADSAADAAGQAFTEWSGTSPHARARVLDGIAQRVKAASETLAQQITLEQGKPMDEARLEMSGVVGMFEHFAEMSDTMTFAYDRPGYGARRRIDMVPVGPVIVITTWNFPVETAAVHIAPALAAGCTVVVLANNDTPSSVAMLVDILNQSDLPKGAVNLVMGSSRVLSTRLIKHRAMRHLSYTGSVNVGRDLAAQCGAEIMRCTLELGGNAPAIVLPGSNVEEAAQALISKRFWNGGQVCTAPNRIYVNRDQHDAFAELAGAYARGLVLGDGMDVATTMGPLANIERVQTMDQIAADAIAKGSTVILNDPARQNEGFFAPPRVFANVPDDALGMTEEIFGPIACIAPYDDLDDIMARANACELGLSGYVYGPDQTAAEAVGARLQVGSVAVNQLTTAYIDVPFGGLKLSGLGCVGGESAVNEYLFPRLTAMKP
ncbi:4-(hydroxymethyl)benzenesulfonate dehydrogenase TsaD1 [Falsiruegeria litorea R37]|uniref:4-(Hydroxymethyl)benzenesulfonate dehydrogenase TsaD1 n=1 Tax=Falsiruegeria litorea R37 TaxID=1200284 RepID=A0A1Y5TUL1_9RHOB|nr:aldehyde dehydrogenase family protein [Falsiruegeria litorea]SLN73254.1 4-(hydroxymethyl)benzenesulfonate dehydrogenase TsaD1 [Falsiruegeria litorea R37]